MPVCACTIRTRGRNSRVKICAQKRSLRVRCFCCCSYSGSKYVHSPACRYKTFISELKTYLSYLFRLYWAEGGSSRRSLVKRNTYVCSISDVSAAGNADKCTLKAHATCIGPAGPERLHGCKHEANHTTLILLPPLFATFPGKQLAWQKSWINMF